MHIGKNGMNQLNNIKFAVFGFTSFQWQKAGVVLMISIPANIKGNK